MSVDVRLIELYIAKLTRCASLSLSKSSKLPSKLSGTDSFRILNRRASSTVQLHPLHHFSNLNVYKTYIGQQVNSIQILNFYLIFRKGPVHILHWNNFIQPSRLAQYFLCIISIGRCQKFMPVTYCVSAEVLLCFWLDSYFHSIRSCHLLKESWRHTTAEYNKICTGQSIK